MAGGLASINIRFAVNLAELSTGLQNASRIAEKEGKRIQEVGKNLSMYVTAPLLAIGGASVKMASDFEESQNKVDVAFKESSDVVREFGKTTLATYGIAEGSALDMAALFGDMATSMGLPRDAAAAMSTSLVGLAGDLASFKNIGIAQATTALNGVFTGETESLKMLGIVMTEANLAQFALSQGINKSIKDFTQAEKVQLRYRYVMAQTVNAQGDFSRTGGGAANQTRVLTEGIKELAVQIGNEMLPLYTEIVKMTNNVIAKFKEMDPEMRKWIVIVGGAAAAVGPLLVGVGGLVRVFPVVVQGAKAVSTAIALLSGNFIAIGVAVAAGVAAYAYFTRESQRLNVAQKTMNDLNDEAVRITAAKKSQLMAYLRVANDERKSVDDRRDAISKMNKLSPEYLGNLTLETIGTDKAREAIEKYNTALLQAAKAKAADTMLGSNLEKQAAAIARYEIKVAQAGAKTEEVLFNNPNKNFEQVAQNAYKSSKAVQAAYAEMENTLIPLREQEKILRRVYDKFYAQLGVLDDNTVAATNFNSALSGGAKTGTIAYYEEQIKKLKELQTQFETTPEGVAVLQARIDELQKRIDALNGKRIEVKTVLSQVGEPPADLSQSQGTVDWYDKQIAKMRMLQSEVMVTSDAFRTLEVTIAELELEKEIKFDLPIDEVNNFSNTYQNFGQKFIQTSVRIQEQARQMEEIARGVADGFANAFESMGGRFLDSLSMAEDGLQGFFKGLASVVIKIIAAMLAQSMANAIGGATSAGAATGPAAIVTTPAFIASAISGVLAAFAAIPRFETGGIVGGNSFFGDHILARVNSGEMILNQRQQRRIYDMINPAGDTINISLDGAFKLSGSDLELMIERVQRRNSRNR